MNLRIAGTAAQNNLPAAFTRRAALIARIGVPHIFCDWSINDVIAGRTAAELASGVASIAAGFKSGARRTRDLVHADAARRIDRCVADGGEPERVGEPRRRVHRRGRVGPVAVQRAAAAGIGGVDSVFDAADAVETAHDSGVWRAGDGSSHLTASETAGDAATNDGLHPTAFNTAAPGLGDVYILAMRCAG